MSDDVQFLGTFLYGRRALIPPQHRAQRQYESIGGVFPVAINENVPEGEVWCVDGTGGKVLSRLTNLS